MKHLRLCSPDLWDQAAAGAPAAGSDLINQQIADRLDEVAGILHEQGASMYRVQAYRKAAVVLRELVQPVSELYQQKGIPGLVELPGVGESIARSIRDILLHGRLGMLERLRGESDPLALLRTVPGIGPGWAGRLHDELHIQSLEDLERAAHSGSLEKVRGLGPKRIEAIRDCVAQRLGRLRPPIPHGGGAVPSVAELLSVDEEYRHGAIAGTLKTIAPRRFNPGGEAWLPVLHTVRGERHYTALYSNTERAHQLGKTRDWVVLYHDGDAGEGQCTVITAEFGRLRGRRLVRGRESECEAHYGLSGG